MPDQAQGGLQPHGAALAGHNGLGLDNLERPSFARVHVKRDVELASHVQVDALLAGGVGASRQARMLYVGRPLHGNDQSMREILSYLVT